MNNNFIHQKIMVYYKKKEGLIMIKSFIDSLGEFYIKSAIAIPIFFGLISIVSSKFKKY